MAFVRVNNSGLKDSSSIRFREYKKKILKNCAAHKPQIDIISLSIRWLVY